MTDGSRDSLQLCNLVCVSCPLSVFTGKLMPFFPPFREILLSPCQLSSRLSPCIFEFVRVFEWCILDGAHERQRRRPETDPIKNVARETGRVGKRGMKEGMYRRKLGNWHPVVRERDLWRRGEDIRGHKCEQGKTRQEQGEEIFTSTASLVIKSFAQDSALLYKITLHSNAPGNSGQEQKRRRAEGFCAVFWNSWICI